MDLSLPSQTHSGRYWYNLHLVLVAEGRYRTVEEGALIALRDGFLQSAREHGHRISVLGVMPDHMHAAVRGNVEISPEDIALAFQNDVARIIGCAVWTSSYCAGTFGSYTMEAIPRNLRAV